MNVGRFFSNFFNFLAIFFATFSVHAMNGRTTYQAKIIKPDGLPLTATTVQFRFTVLDPTAACVLYIEDYANVNMSGSGGLISLTLGLGVRAFPSSGTLTFAQVFDNSTPMFNCQTPGAYNPVPADNRRIVMQFNDGSGWQTLPAMAINAVPYAMYATKANDSLLLNNKTDSAFVEYSTLAGLGCAANQALHFNGVSFTCLNTGGSYTVTANDVTTALGYTPTNAASFTTLNSQTSTSFTTVTNTVNSVSSAVSSLAASTAASLAAITSSQWTTTASGISYSSGNVGIGTSNPVVLLDVYSGSGSANVNVKGAGNGSNFSVLSLRSDEATSKRWDFSHRQNPINSMYISYYNGSTWINPLVVSASGSVGIGTTTPVTKLSVSGGLQISMESATCAVSYAGTLRYNAGSVEFCNGTTWSAFSTGSVTSASIQTALGYTPANATAIATSFTAVSNSLTTVSTSFSTVTNTLTALTTSHTNLTAAVSAITSSQWTTSGTTINYMNGSVAIGTVDPQGPLHILSSSPNAMVLERTNSNNSHIQYKSTVGSVYAGLNTAGSFAIGPNLNLSSSPFMTVQSGTGYIGIGTAAPTQKLSIHGDSARLLFRATTSDLADSGSIDFAEDNNSHLRLRYDGQPVAGSNGRLVIAAPVEGRDIASFDRSGNVGIGTASATARLTVSGSVVTPTNEITTGSAVNLALSNTHYLASVGGSTITLSNMINGGVYTIIVADTTPRTYTFSGCTNAYFSPSNDDTESGAQTIYGLTTIFVGGAWRCYITWSTGFVP